MSPVVPYNSEALEKCCNVTEKISKNAAIRSSGRCLQVFAAVTMSYCLSIPFYGRKKIYSQVWWKGHPQKKGTFNKRTPTL